MSPPCQPYSRQGAGLDDADPRSCALTHLCRLISPDLQMVCCENVVGFEKSRSFHNFKTALLTAGFRITGWHLSPTMIGVPNVRPRFFFCAVRSSKEAIFELRTGWPVDVVPRRRRVVGEFLEEEEVTEKWILPPDLLKQEKAWCLDIVDGQATETACFTRSYGRFLRGTGSVLLCGGATTDSLDLGPSTPEDRPFDKEWSRKLRSARLRYLTPREIANLLGFPPEDTDDGLAFRLPDALMSDRAKWAALGNSLHVDAAAAVISVALAQLLLNEDDE